MSSSDPGRPPFGTPQSGQSGQSGQPPYGQQPQSQPPYGQQQQPYGQQPYDPYGQRPFGTPPPQQRKRSRFTGALSGVLSLVLSVLCFPVGLILGIVAIVLAVRALRVPGPPGQRNPVLGRAVAGLVTGIIGFLFSAACVGLVVWMWPAVSTYATCTSAATTNTDRSQCQQQWTNAVARKFGINPASVPSLGP